MFYPSIKCHLAAVSISLLTCFSSDAISKTIVVFGDSISAAYGMEANQGWVGLLSDRLTEQYPQYTVVNASVS